MQRFLVREVQVAYRVVSVDRSLGQQAGECVAHLSPRLGCDRPRSYLRITDAGETSSTVIYHRFLPTVIVNGKFSLGTFTAVIE